MRIGTALLLIAVRTLSKSAVTPAPQRHRGVTGGDVLKIVGGVGQRLILVLKTTPPGS
jgi:hypothetical protein